MFIEKVFVHEVDQNVDESATSRKRRELANFAKMVLEKPARIVWLGDY